VRFKQHSIIQATCKWVIGKTTTDDEGKPSFDVYGQAPAISATKQLILVIRSAKGDAGGLALIPMDYSKTGFDGGKYLLVNATNVDIGGASSSRNLDCKT